MIALRYLVGSGAAIVVALCAVPILVGYLLLPRSSGPALLDAAFKLFACHLMLAAAVGRFSVAALRSLPRTRQPSVRVARSGSVARP